VLTYTCWPWPPRSQNLSIAVPLTLVYSLSHLRLPTSISVWQPAWKRRRVPGSLSSIKYSAVDVACIHIDKVYVALDRVLYLRACVCIRTSVLICRVHKVLSNQPGTHSPSALTSSAVETGIIHTVVSAARCIACAWPAWTRTRKSPLTQHAVTSKPRCCRGVPCRAVGNVQRPALTLDREPEVWDAAAWQMHPTAYHMRGATLQASMSISFHLLAFRDIQRLGPERASVLLLVTEGAAASYVGASGCRDIGGAEMPMCDRAWVDYQGKA